jgi:16S rRNA (cytosine967-C5)-methyltransferase
MAASSPTSCANSWHVPDLSPQIARVIRYADRQHPADAVLRSQLREARWLTPAQRREISTAVFAYYRWFAWLDARSSLRDQIAQAMDLARRGTQKFSDHELIAKAVPAWLAQTMDVTPSFARALQSPPRLWLRARKGQGIQLAERLGNCRPSSVPDALEYLGDDDLYQRAEFKTGAFEIQDLHSQIVSRLADPQPGHTWWDACAGEGGKTLHLSDLMDNKGLIWSSDRAAWRLEKLKRRAARAAVFNYRVAPWDGHARLPTKTKFDGVLVDAPCSGVGTWQRNPHARWTTTVQDVEELAQVQKRLLGYVTPAIKPGGKLVYAVCTLTRAETTEVVEALGAEKPEFALQAATFLRLEETGGNGMFVALWNHHER